MKFTVLTQLPLVSLFTQFNSSFFITFYLFLTLMPKPAGMLPPFAIQSEETRAMARHCSTGIEPRISTERIILLDTQVIISTFLNLHHFFIFYCFYCSSLLSYVGLWDFELYLCLSFLHVACI